MLEDLSVYLFVVNVSYLKILFCHWNVGVSDYGLNFYWCFLAKVPVAMVNLSNINVSWLQLLRYAYVWKSLVDSFLLTFLGTLHMTTSEPVLIEAHFISSFFFGFLTCLPLQTLHDLLLEYLLPLWLFKIFAKHQ